MTGQQHPLGQERRDSPAGYHPPTVTYLGDLADLTQQAKDVGLADGSTFMGLDLAS